MLSSEISSLFHPQLPLFPPSFPSSLASCPLWPACVRFRVTQTSYLLSFRPTPPCFPPTPTFLLPRLLVVCVGQGRGAWIALPSAPVRGWGGVGAQPL